MTRFQLPHQRAFGLEIVERHPTTSEVVAVRCLFCVHLGREPAPESAVRKRRRTMQVWTKFAPQNYRSHHDGQHAEQWARYQACSPAEKDAFFIAHTKSQGDRSDDTSDDCEATETSANKQRPAGRPPRDEGGAVPIQWSNIMTRHLVKLRLQTFGTWFKDLENSSAVHDGWTLVASALSSEFGVVVDAEQCQTKYRLVSHQLEELHAEQVTSKKSTNNSTMRPSTERGSAPTSFDSTAREIAQEMFGRGLRSTRSSTSEDTAATTVTRGRLPSGEGVLRSASGKRPRARRDESSSSNGNQNSLSSSPTTISSLLNLEESAVTQSLLRQALLPPRKKQRGQLVEDADSSDVESEADEATRSSSSSEINTLLLVRILRAVEEQTRSSKELLKFLRKQASQSGC